MVTFGPVPSRRLGSSLGVSLIPRKTCTYNCVYCQLGRTTDLCIKRRSFFSKESVIKEIADRVSMSRPDYITFTGDGEPTLSKDLGWILRRAKETWDIPLALITNGSLLFMDEVLEDIQCADVIMPSLDAGIATTFARINRPHRDIHFKNLINGLRSLQYEFSGKVWLEVMLVDSLNDSPDQVRETRNALNIIKPDRIQVLTPTRPPAERWVETPKAAAFLRALKILRGTVVQGVSRLNKMESGRFEIGDQLDAREAIWEISSRHPLRRGQIGTIEAELNAIGTVDAMCLDGELIEIRHQGETYVVPPRKADTAEHDKLKGTPTQE